MTDHDMSDIFTPEDEQLWEQILKEASLAPELGGEITTEDITGLLEDHQPEPEKHKAAPAGRRKPKAPLVILCAVLAVCVLAGGWFGITALLDPYDNRILPNVTVGGLDVGGMTKGEARKALKQASEELLLSQPLTVALAGGEVKLNPEDTQLKLNTSAAVREAFRYGRSGTDAENAAAYAASAKESHAVGLSPYLEVNTEYIRTALEGYAAEQDTDLTEPAFRLEGAAPDLEAESKPTEEDCQTLVITMGIPKTRLDVAAVEGQILAVYDQPFAAADAGFYGLTVAAPEALEVPQAPDLDAILASVGVDAVNDTVDMVNYTAIPGAYGYSFDRESAQALVAEAGYGQEVSIPMVLVEPEIFGEEVFFQDVLGSCDTPHTDDEDRNHNLTLACKAIDGMILQPGETFSYNDTLGERTEARGYKRAGAYSGTVLVRSFGGGICQGSSTLYLCTLIADLEIVHRVNHGYAVSYIPIGLDATVNWGKPDFQFRNNFHFPIKLTAKLEDGYVKMQILGTDEKDYYVEMESEASYGHEYTYAKSFKCKYDKQTGELISRELEARSNYMVYGMH